MLKNTLIKCAQLLDRDDLIDEIKNVESVNDIKNKLVQNDIIKLISYYNFITKTICENYIDLVRVDEFISDADRRIYYNFFIFKPIKILSVKSSKFSESFNIFSDYIMTSKANVKYEIEYKFLPEEVYDFCDKICNKNIISESILSEGIVSQYLASKGKYNESEYWNNKFMFDLFKLKCKKGRRLKPHFKL